MTYLIKITLLLLISVISTIVHSQDQFATVGLFQFNPNCFSSDSSFSFDAEAEARSIDYCSSKDLIGGLFFKLNTCQYFSGFFMILENVNGKFNLSTYNDNQCTQYSNSMLVSPNDCKNICGSFPFKISSIINSNDIKLPKSSVSVIQYPGECNGSWEKSFQSIEYSYLNLCTSSLGGNYLYTCNSTSVALQHNSFADDCSSNAGEITITSSCDGAQNYQVICNE